MQQYGSEPSKDSVKAMKDISRSELEEERLERLKYEVAQEMGLEHEDLPEPPEEE
jgi:hypothetical protein